MNSNFLFFFCNTVFLALISRRMNGGRKIRSFLYLEEDVTTPPPSDSSGMVDPDSCPPPPGAAFALDGETFCCAPFPGDEDPDLNFLLRTEEVSFIPRIDEEEGLSPAAPAEAPPSATSPPPGVLAASLTLTMLCVLIIGVLCRVRVQMTKSRSYWYRSLSGSHGRRSACLYSY